MNATRRIVLGSALFLAVCRSVSGGDLFMAGRDLNEARDVGLRITAGSITEIEAFVQETTRAYYDATDQSYKQDLAEDYSLNDFDMEGPFATVGLSYENAAKYFTFQFDMSLMNPKTDTVAGRNYYIQVGEAVEYGGGSYENMMIPEGTEFSLELIGGLIDLRCLFTPFTFKPSDGFQFTPYLDLGFFLLLGYYDLDAGEPTGTVRYMDPPEDFVVGGSSAGFVGGGLPELGLGGEMRFGGEAGVNLVLKGHYSVCEYGGSSRYLTTASHREKDIDIDHTNLRCRCLFEIPMSEDRMFTIGVQYRSIESDASVTSQEAAVEDIVAQHERFDKDVSFKISSVMGLVGVTF